MPIGLTYLLVSVDGGVEEEPHDNTSHRYASNVRDSHVRST